MFSAQAVPLLVTSGIEQCFWSCKPQVSDEDLMISTLCSSLISNNVATYTKCMLRRAQDRKKTSSILNQNKYGLSSRKMMHSERVKSKPPCFVFLGT